MKSIFATLEEEHLTPNANLFSDFLEPQREDLEKEVEISTDVLILYR